MSCPQTVLKWETMRHFDRLVVGHLDYLIVQIGIEHIWSKASTQTLNLVPSGFAARKHTVAGLDGNGPELWLTLLNPNSPRRFLVRRAPIENN
jgi:hypothetical protein